MPNFFTQSQLNTILSAIDYEPLKQIVIFAVNTGVRISELINIKWRNIDFGNMTIRIFQDNNFQTKSKKDRSIPMNETIYNLLSGMERKGEYVFCRLDGEKRDKHFITRKFKAYLREVSLGEYFSFHSLRHTFASHLVQRGVSLYIVSKLLGHSSPKTTEIYAHLAPEQFHSVVELLDDNKKISEYSIKRN